MKHLPKLHAQYDLPVWPSAKKLTPQAIYGLTDAELNLAPLELNKRLKTTYNKYLKLYHPDIANQMELYDENNTLMDLRAKRLRFDTIQDSYNLLKDPKRRFSYSRSVNTNWDNYSRKANNRAKDPSTSHFGDFYAFRMANAHRQKYKYQNDEAFWTAANWEDYYKMRYNKAPPSKEEFEKNKYKILAGVLVIMAITTTIQLILAFEKSNELQYQAYMQTLLLQKQHDQVAANRFDRMRSMLLHRRNSVQDDDKRREMAQNDAEVLTDYAKKLVQRSEPRPE